MSRKTATVILVAFVVLLSAWRGACVVAGPDIDTDAYAHHMIARAILQDPGDLGVHWVWLPLFHYLEVPLVLAGGSLDAVRWVNVLLAGALPCVLFEYVRRTAKVGAAGAMSPNATALFAAVISASCPIAMQMGTTGQPEPLFALLVLLFAIASEKRRGVAAACLLGAGVMLRYEAWACLAAVVFETTLASLWAAWRAPRGDGLHEAERAWKRGDAWLVAALPTALIVFWAALRRPVDGRWFGFLQDTRQFATGAMHEQSALDRGLAGLVRDLAFYPLVVPARVFGPALLLAPFGVLRTVRQQGPRFTAAFAACLGFITLSWVMRSSLGLDRHFVAAVALYATFAAQGAASVADFIGAVVRRRRSERWAMLLSTTTAAFVAGVSVLALGLQLRSWMAFWKADIQRGLPYRAEVANFLRTLPVGPIIFCDDATLEITSGLDRRRFDRHWVDDPHTWDLVQDAAQIGGTAYVATWSRKLRGHDRAGAVVFRAGETDGDENSGASVMRVEASGSSGR